MKICFAVSAMNCGGAERVVSTLSREFAHRGHAVDIVMVSVGEKECFYDLDYRVTLHALCEGVDGRVPSFRRIFMLRDFYQNLSPDIVIAFLPHVCIYTCLALKGTNIPFVLSERNDPNTYSLLMKLLLKHSFSAADGCVFQTHDAIQWYRHKKKPTDRVIFNAVGLTSLPETGLKIERRNNLLFVGRFDRQKNYRLLLEGYEKLLKKHKGLLLDVYGDGPDKEAFFGIAESLGVEKSIIYHGRSSTWHSEQYDAGVYVSTSDYEGMSNSLEEAAALGIPCVATNCPIGGSKELASVFDNIVLTPVGDVDSFVECVETAMEMQSYFKGIHPRVSKQVIAEEWLSLLGAAINGGNTGLLEGGKE